MNTRPDQIDDDAAGLPDDEDDLTATLRSTLSELSASSGETDEEDDGGFNAPLDDGTIEARETVTEEDGVKRVQEARDKATSAAAKKGEEDDPLDLGEKKKAPAASPNADEKPKEATEQNDAAKQEEPAKALASDDDYNSAIGGLSEGVRNRIQSEREEYLSVMAPFKGREEQLKTLGVEPKGAVEWFVNVNDYAQRDPAGYAAWAINQTSGGDATKVEAFLKGAAEKLGYTISKAEAASDDDDDDPFMSDRERELLEENRRLKGAQQAQAPDYGPDSQAEVARRSVMDVIAEQGPDGNPLRPHFETLQPLIVQIVKDQVQRTGKPMDAASLAKAYEQAELAHPETREAATERLIESRKFAAQGNVNVTEQNDKRAAATARAKAASSKIIDGPGQGASRQPAKEDANMGLEDFLRSQLKGGS